MYKNTRLKNSPRTSTQVFASNTKNAILIGTIALAFGSFITLLKGIIPSADYSYPAIGIMSFLMTLILKS